MLLVEHDLLRKLVSTFRGHAPDVPINLKPACHGPRMATRLGLLFALRAGDMRIFRNQAPNRNGEVT
jgi:hypothetical protein